MAEPESHYAVPLISWPGRVINHHRTNLVAYQNNTTSSCPNVFWDISNCESPTPVSTRRVATNLVFLEDTYRWYVLKIFVKYHI